ncbi:MAG: 4-(cytidine 5'-diphospho)-2-C-methyl-D-erythritol kinase [Sphingomonadales bacterium]|nr:4-(cytidine 5'-diphospho)-2-C-methyl-D-erythritol kinase [Sphingomonadales bacterium]MDE2169519.1 4-(cytidine 5'-diphospho)-2-C-methyl-D-erythritol kinase [Sphingomonadales bacterium]
MLTETAYAKINLALHVRRRREDGYHELETYFAFVDAGDGLTVEEAAADALTIHGEFAPLLAGEEGNLVLDALALLPRDAGWRVALDKALPVAAGLGGGSADVGAVFRLMRRVHGLPDGWQAAAARLGADVPACVESVSMIGRGTGTDLAPAPTDLAGCPVLLVNPRVPLPTGPVFRAWDGMDRGAMPQGTAREIAVKGRNDLEAPAISICPPVADVLAALGETGAFLSRMSGSGATCFALFEDAAARDDAAARFAADHPGWWHLAGALR